VRLFSSRAYFVNDLREAIDAGLIGIGRQGFSGVDAVYKSYLDVERPALLKVTARETLNAGVRVAVIESAHDREDLDHVFAVLQRNRSAPAVIVSCLKKVLTDSPVQWILEGLKHPGSRLSVQPGLFPVSRNYRGRNRYERPFTAPFFESRNTVSARHGCGHGPVTGLPAPARPRHCSGPSAASSRSAVPVRDPRHLCLLRDRRGRGLLLLSGFLVPPSSWPLVSG
jgi:hypothetical protein